MAIARYSVALLVAAGITLGLFYIMQALISQTQKEKNDIYSGKIIDFVRLRKDSAIETRKRQLPDKVKPDQPPPPPRMNLSESVSPDANALAIGGPDIDFDIDLGGPSLGGFEGNAEAVPLVRVQPIYPERAAARGIEGWVDIEFTITTTGAVRDAKVLASHPSSIFNRSALKAVSKFKYKPKVVEGIPVDQPGQQIRLSFAMDK